MKRIAKHLKKQWFKYVFDTLVVIIGILIAFALNSWNDRRLNKNLMQSYAKSLIIDLENDIKEAKTVRSQMQESIIRIDSLAKYTRSKQVKELSNLDLAFAMSDYMYRPFVWNRATIENLKLSGILRLKGNDSLSKKIVAYEAFTKHLEEDYHSDLAMKENNSNLANEIVNLNYPNFEDLSYYSYVNHSILEYNFSSSEPYHTAQKENLTLITVDIHEIQKFVNGNLRLRFFLNVRVNYELPKLIHQAEEIKDLLTLNYID